MALCDKIRQARLEAGLSQKALCGDTITRNMLSLIENGNAKPSMATLSYIAQRLGKPVSYFLEEAAVVSENQGVITAARAAYAQADYSRAQELLAGYETDDALFDAEFFLLNALTQVALAEQAIAQGRSVYALTLLERAQQALRQTPYATEALQRHILVLHYGAKPSLARVLAESLPDNTQETCLRAEAALQQGQPQKAAAILDAHQSSKPQWQLLRGTCAMQLQQYAEAARYYHGAEEAYPQQTAAALEQCYRELQDYKMAYQYACKQRENKGQ